MHFRFWFSQWRNKEGLHPVQTLQKQRGREGEHVVPRTGVEWDKSSVGCRSLTQNSPQLCLVLPPCALLVVGLLLLPGCRLQGGAWQFWYFSLVSTWGWCSPSLTPTYITGFSSHAHWKPHCEFLFNRLLSYNSIKYVGSRCVLCHLCFCKYITAALKIRKQ